MDQRDQFKCKIYKDYRDNSTYLYLLNNLFNGAIPYEDFIPEKYGFKYSYYLTHILDYTVHNKDRRSPFVYLINDNKINNIKIKIK